MLAVPRAWVTCGIQGRENRVVVGERNACFRLVKFSHHGDIVMFKSDFFLFQIEKLSQESIQHPTPLLKLLFAWSKNSRFFPLLSRKPVEKPDLSIMSCVFACLQVPSVSEDVVAMVMEMADNLLATSQAETGDEKFDLLECGSELT